MLPALNSVNHRLYTYKNFSFSDIKKNRGASNETPLFFCMSYMFREG